MINWPPDRVTTEQFAGRIRQHLGGQGYVFTADVGYEYLIADGTIYRVASANAAFGLTPGQPVEANVTGSAKAVMTIEEAIGMDDETLVARCKA